MLTHRSMWPAGLLALSLAGCVTPPVPQEDSHLAAARAHLDSVLHSTQAELAAMRAQAAEAKLAAAEKDARLQEMTRQLADARRAGIEARQSMEQERAELLALQSERDQLTHAKRDLESMIQATQSAKRDLERQLTDLAQSHQTLQTEKKDLESRVSEVQHLQQAASAAKTSEAQTLARLKELETLLGQRPSDSGVRGKKAGAKPGEKPVAAKKDTGSPAADQEPAADAKAPHTDLAGDRANPENNGSAAPTLDSLMKGHDRSGPTSAVTPKAPGMATAQLREPSGSAARPTDEPATAKP